MLQIESYQNNHLIINVFFKIIRKGREVFSVFCYICTPKQRKMNIRERVGTLRSRLEMKNSSFQHQTRVL